MKKLPCMALKEIRKTKEKKKHPVRRLTPSRLIIASPKRAF